MLVHICLFYYSDRKEQLWSKLAGCDCSRENPSQQVGIIFKGLINKVSQTSDLMGLWERQTRAKFDKDF
jgi:hypothetical protein